MDQEAAVATGNTVDVMCFNFHNPSSVNGPFGTFELWVDGSSVEGRMILVVLFGRPKTTYLNLSGTATGSNPHVCRLEGKGYTTQLGHPPVKAQLGMTVTLDASWSDGTISFAQGMTGFTGGLPVQHVACPSST